MTKEQVNIYIVEFTNNFPELKEYKGIIYIKWDGLPYELREFIFSLPEYNKEKMIGMDRDCGCGTAYFYNAIDFYSYLKKWKGPINK